MAEKFVADDESANYWRGDNFDLVVSGGRGETEHRWSKNPIGTKQCIADATLFTSWSNICAGAHGIALISGQTGEYINREQSASTVRLLDGG
jgi:hypothetical protein